MAHRHLHELLLEDQEPFVLKSYVADRLSQLKRPSPRPVVQLKKRRPPPSCFFSYADSPEVRKSPFVDFPSPGNSRGTVFLHVPARTAAVLLDAAVRIQKHSAGTKSGRRDAAIGLFGSTLKRLKGSKSKKGDGFDRMGVSVRDSCLAHGKSPHKSSIFDGFSNNSRISSANWSESNEEKSLDMETSCSSRSEESGFVGVGGENDGFPYDEKCCCESPSSPFRFSLLNAPSPVRRTPVFSSPARSPRTHCNKSEQEKKGSPAEIYEQVHVVEGEKEEEKEQCSPVSVLDPLYDDDDMEELEIEVDDGNHDLDDGYENVQRAKDQLLKKLRRFELLAGFDPIELERRMVEQDEDEDRYCNESEGEGFCNGDESTLFDGIAGGFITEFLSKSGLDRSGKIPPHAKRLVFDLYNEAKREGEGEEEEITARVTARLDLWREVESNTIDMMVESDFKNEAEGWKERHQEQEREVGRDVEFAILGLLLEELSEDLVWSGRPDTN